MFDIKINNIRNLKENIINFNIIKYDNYKYLNVFCDEDKTYTLDRLIIDIQKLYSIDNNNFYRIDGTDKNILIITDEKINKKITNDLDFINYVKLKNIKYTIIKIFSSYINKFNIDYLSSLDIYYKSEKSDNKYNVIINDKNGLGWGKVCKDYKKSKKDK